MEHYGGAIKIAPGVKSCGITLMAIVLCLAGAALAAAPDNEEGPVAGVLIGDAVNIRSGPNINFEVVIKLDKNAPVLITGQKQDWFKINLPHGSKAYVHQKFVTRQRGMMGLITGQRVNIRAGADTKYNVLGQLNTNDRIAIIGQEGEWYKIYSFRPLSGWVKKELVKKQGDVSVYQQAEQKYQQSFNALEQAELKEEQERQKPVSQQNHAALAEQYRNIAQTYPESPAAQIAGRRLAQVVQEPQPARTLVSTPAAPVAPPPTVADIISAEGKIMETGRFFNRRWTHKLVQGRKVLYYLKSDTLNLNEFVYYRVTVWGSIEELPRSAISLMLVTQVKPIIER